MLNLLNLARARPSFYIFAAIALAAVGSAVFLWQFSPPAGTSRASLDVTKEFFSRALWPALTYEGEGIPDSVEPIFVKALRAAGTTVLFAGAGVGLALVLGIILSLLGSHAWWAGSMWKPILNSERQTVRGLPLATCGGVESSAAKVRAVEGSAISRSALSVLLWSRVTAAILRSVHEILWAVIFLSAFGFTRIGAVLAIAIPYAGVFAKVFSELFDEAPEKTTAALEMIGASRRQAFTLALLPQAFPDLLAYSLYRFECGLRSSAVLGFFGFPTLGYFISASFENLYYGEVWTYLYVLAGLIIVVDVWSAAVRRRLVA